ncbi:MAG: hypothetical protein IKE23_00665 [Exiguobacterium sp.]|nr:hypothetical protein [Exiguobacterium sp.]
MDVNGVVTIVQTVGFPIAMCVAMGWYVKYTEDRHREDRNGQNERHEKEMESVNKAIDNNTTALHALEKAIAVKEASGNG